VVDHYGDYHAMTRPRFQNASYLPVDRAITAIDAICAKHPDRSWDDQIVRREIFAAARGRMIEIGIAKRILHAARPADAPTTHSTAGMEHLKEMWDRIKIRSGQGMRDERLRRRRRIHDAAGKLIDEGLSTIQRSMLGMDWSSGEDMSGITIGSAAVAKALQDLAVELQRTDHTDADNSTAWRSIGEAGRAIHALETLVRRKTSRRCLHERTRLMPITEGRRTALSRCSACNRDIDEDTGLIVAYRDGRYVYADSGRPVP